MNCPKNMSLPDCELQIVRKFVDESSQIQGTNFIKDPKILEIIDIVEQFLKDKKRICYGGTAINNILPKKHQFYDKKIEFPDYDFFSPDAMNDAKRLADIYFKKGFNEVEAKAGVHHGTYKVYVNFTPVADITFLTPEIYKTLLKKAVVVGGIYYAPPDYLRMAMYLELSRPLGDTSRWEKVLKRLTLLNKQFPLKGAKCKKKQIQRLFGKTKKHIDSDKVFNIVREALISEGVVFFGALANTLYLKNLKQFKNTKIQKVPDFDVLSKDPENVATTVQQSLESSGLKGITIVKKDGVGEIIAPHYEVKIENETVVFIYEPLACHSYNIIRVGGNKIKVATIDTMLSFYLAFIHVSRPYYDPTRILCMSELLFKVQEQNRLQQKGLLKRFSIDCVGEQATMASIRAEKNLKHKELNEQRGTEKYNEYFLRHIPAEQKNGTLKNSKKERIPGRTLRRKTRRWGQKPRGWKRKPRRKPRGSRKKWGKRKSSSRKKRRRKKGIIENLFGI